MELMKTGSSVSSCTPAGGGMNNYISHTGSDSNPNLSDTDWRHQLSPVALRNAPEG